jgi:hypothetical protein
MLCCLGGSGGCFATFVVLSIFTPLALYYLLAGSVVVVTRFAGSPVSSPSFLLFSLVVRVACHLPGGEVCKVCNGRTAFLLMK